MSEILPNYTLYVKNLNDRIKKEELKRSLYYLFSNYGKVVDIVALKTQKCRGQAFIIFSEIPFATLALKSLQDFNLFGKNMKIFYAKTTSKAIKLANGFQNDENRLNGVNGNGYEEEEFEGDVHPKPSTYVPETESSQNPPNRLLFIENLSEKASNKEQLEHLFKQYQGLLDIRLIESNTSIAFIEYETVNQAAVVREGLQGFKFLGNNLRISFAK